MQQWHDYGGSLPEEEEKDFPTMSATINKLEKVNTFRGWKKNRDSDDQLAEDIGGIAKQFTSRRGPVMEFNKNNTRLQLFNNASNRSNGSNHHQNNSMGQFGDDNDDGTDIQQNDIHDVISASIKNDSIYKLIDQCLHLILTVWDPTVIVKKTTLDIESELILNLCDTYEALLDQFYNSSHEICTILHQIACKIVQFYYMFVIIIKKYFCPFLPNQTTHPMVIQHKLFKY